MPISLLADGGVASDLHLLVVLLAAVLPPTCRSPTCTRLLRVTIYGCINMLARNVSLAALHLICNVAPKGDFLSGIV